MPAALRVRVSGEKLSAETPRTGRNREVPLKKPAKWPGSRGAGWNLEKPIISKK